MSKKSKTVYESRVTVRLDNELLDFVKAESVRMKQKPSAVVRMIVAEKMRSEESYKTRLDNPSVAFRDRTIE